MVEQNVTMQTPDKSSVEQKKHKRITALTEMNDQLLKEMAKLKAISSAHIANIEEEKDLLEQEKIMVTGFQ